MQCITCGTSIKGKNFRNVVVLDEADVGAEIVPSCEEALHDECHVWQEDVRTVPLDPSPS